jgi:uncharacterized protein (TIGR04255 family)
MSSYKPFSADHAVEQAIVGVRWRHKPSDDRFNSAIELATEISQQFGLPGKVQLDPFSLLTRQNISFGFEGPGEPQAGLLFQQVYPDGSMAQEMTLERGAVTFRTRNYRRWSDIQEIIQHAISPLVDIICENEPENISVIELRCSDKFISTSGEVPPLSSLVTGDTQFIPEYLRDSSTYMHSHLGWFEILNSDVRLLYNLNLSVQNEGGSDSPVANILQVISHHRNAGVAEACSVRQLIEATFDDLHARDKGLLFALLRPEVCEQISLSGASEATAI